MSEEKTGPYKCEILPFVDLIGFEPITFSGKELV